MALFFYIFSLLVILGSVGVVASRNSVHSVLWMIFVFCNASGLFILLGAEFLAMTLIIVYVGAVAVLFLFVVMMLGNKVIGIQATEFSPRSMMIGGVILTILLFDLILVVFASTNGGVVSFASNDIANNITNTHAIGAVLYTNFMLPFQLSGIVLFVAMIGCIALTLEGKVARKRQDCKVQLSHNKANSIKLVNPNLNRGVDGVEYE